MSGSQSDSCKRVFGGQQVGAVPSKCSSDPPLPHFHCNALLSGVKKRELSYFFDEVTDKSDKSMFLQSLAQC